MTLGTTNFGTPYSTAVNFDSSHFRILYPNRFTSRRRRPYTEAGIRRKRCVRCGAQANATWEICADGNYKRPLCTACDVALNRLVLEWVGHPDVEVLMERYRP